MDWNSGYYVKLYRSNSPDWLALPVLTRGLFSELLLLADRSGRIQLGRTGLASVAVPLRASWAELEPHMRALLDDGCVIQEDAGTLLIRSFVEAQGLPMTPAERKARSRSRAKDVNKPAETSKCHECHASHDPSRGVTLSHDESRGVTLCHACHDKEQTEQTNKTPPPPPAPSGATGPVAESARRDDLASPGSVGPTEAELVRAYVRGVESATGGTFGRRLDAEDRAQLAYIWDRCVCDNPGEIAKDFLGRLTALVAEWVAAKNNPKDRRYQSGWAVRRFVAWVQERHDAAQDAPERASVVSPWGDPTPDEMASLRGSQGAA